MATKTFCDGCDKELKTNDSQQAVVAIKRNGDTTAWGGSYDLCNACIEQLGRESNPNNWIRIKEAPVKRSLAL